MASTLDTRCGFDPCYRRYISNFHHTRKSGCGDPDLHIPDDDDSNLLFVVDYCGTYPVYLYINALTLANLQFQGDKYCSTCPPDKKLHRQVYI